MAVYISAGVYIQERDNSLYAPAIAPTVIGIVGTATKGPLNTATLVTTEAQMTDIFGVPRTKDMGMHTALEALKECRLLYYCRIAGASVAKGVINVNDDGSGATSGCTPQAANNEYYNLEPGATIVFTDSVAGTATFTATAAPLTSGNAETYNLNAIAAGSPVTLTIKVDQGPTQTCTIASGDVSNFAAVTALEVVTLLNAQIFGIQATVSATSVKIQSDTRGTGSYIQVTGGTGNDATNGLNFSTTEVQGTGNVVSIDAVTGAEIKTVVEAAIATISVSLSVNGAPTFCTVATGAAATIGINATSTAVGAAPLISVPTGVTYAGLDAALSQNTISFTAATDGSHSSEIDVVISTSTIHANLKKVVIMYRDAVVETYDGLYKGTDPSLSNITYYEMITTINSGSTDGAFPASEYVVAADLNAAAEDPTNGTHTLSAGNDGDDWTTGTVIGTVVGKTRTGMQVFGDPELIYITILATPGIAYPAVISEGLSMCQTRADCFYVADPPQSLTPSEVVDWHNGNAGATYVVDQEGRSESGANTTQFNSSYGGLWHDYFTMFDAFNDSNITMPPSAIILRTLGYTDNVADPWWAPAGPNRSQTSSVIELASSPTQGERDLMQMQGNNVNPIALISGAGIVIMGQKTLQKAPTALDRVNVRRLMLYAEKIVATAVLFLTFEPNDPTMWRRFINLVQPVFDDIAARRGIDDFRVIADSSTNTDVLINQNTFLGKIFLIPTKSAEKIVAEFNLLPAGADFTEYAQV